MKKRFIEEQIVKDLKEQQEEENSKLKKLVADICLDNMAQKGNNKKVLCPGMKREAVMHISNYFGASEKKSCQLEQINRTTYRCKRKPKNDNLIKEKFEKIFENNSMYSLSTIHLNLRQDKISIGGQKFIAQ